MKSPSSRRPPYLVRFVLVAILVLTSLPAPLRAQADPDQLGAWYMLFWSVRPGDGQWGAQGDVQFRNWDTLGDLEQLLLRAGLTYSPESLPLMLTAGAAHITSGAFGDSDATTAERRTYLEALVRQPLGDLVFLRHRYRFEQRWVDDQDFRTRFRYALFADVPLNGRGTGAGALYIALYDEVFINGELSVGENRPVERFDRNRLYGGLGYGLSGRFKVQGGYMLQTLAGSSKGQLQASLHASF